MNRLGQLVHLNFAITILVRTGFVLQRGYAMFFMAVQRLLNWGERIGPATCSIIRHLLEDKPHPEMGYRACLGVFSLGRSHGEDRLDAACARALTIGSPKRKTQSILETGLDRHADLFPAAATPLPTHENVRGSDYYH